MEVFDNFDGTVTITLKEKQVNRLLRCLDVLDYGAGTKANKFAAKLADRIFSANDALDGNAGEYSGSVVLKD